MKHTLITLTIILFALTSRGQIFYEKNFSPGVNSIEGKYFNGSSGKGFRSFEKLDSLGRTIEKSSFRNKKLLEETVYLYNNKNDIISSIVIYDVNRPNKIDTTKYEYSYINNRIEFEKCIFPNKDSIIYKLIKNKGDSILTYQKISFYYSPNNKINNHVYETYILSYQNNLLIKKEFIDNKSNKEINNFEYYPNGKLKRRIIKRIPETDSKVVIAGAPYSDNQVYNYTYNSNGRVKKKYIVIDNKSYKLATYEYK